MSAPAKESGTLADLTAHSSEPQGGSNRAFGLVFAAVFAILAAWPVMKGGPLRAWAALISGVFLIFALVAPKVLTPLNRAWTALGALLAKIVSPIMLFLVYVIAVVPTGLVLRLRGKDPLHRRFDPEAKSYWVHREPPGKPDATMSRQF